MIERTDVEVEGGLGEDPPYETKAFLTLSGDFEAECYAYMENMETADIVFELPRNQAENLHKQLGKVLYG